LDGRPTKVGRESDERPTKIGRKSNVGRVELSRRYNDGGRQRYTAMMAGSVTARSVVVALVGNALQLATFLQRCCSNALDVAVLLQWSAAR
jgi:hypothetical protein